MKFYTTQSGAQRVANRMNDEAGEFIYEVVHQYPEGYLVQECGFGEWEQDYRPKGQR